MTKKNFWKSKTFWSGIASIAVGVPLLFDGNTSQGSVAIIAGITAIFGRWNADKPLTI